MIGYSTHSLLNARILTTGTIFNSGRTICYVR